MGIEDERIQCTEYKTGHQRDIREGGHKGGLGFQIFRPREGPGTVSDAAQSQNRNEMT
jgi:hypothetical protein